MKFTKPLPKFDPRSIPVLGIDDHLAGVALERLTPQALRERFRHPPVWTPEHSVEKKFSDREPALAAVLLPLVMRDELTLLLTQRSSHLRAHGGQVAFPGGRTDASDQDDHPCGPATVPMTMPTGCATFDAMVPPRPTATDRRR